MAVEIQMTLGDCLEYLKNYEDNSIDALVQDPPAGINFMGKAFDSDRGGREQWIAWLQEIMTLAFQKMKPGAHGFVWALPRTQHWTMTALENAGFEIREVAMHIFGSGFPKNYDVAKGVEAKLTTGNANWNGFHKLNGERGAPEEKGIGNYNISAAEQGYRPAAYATNGTLTLAPTTELAASYAGYGTALKPSYESWILIKKPHKGMAVADCVIRYGTGAINVDACRVGLNGEKINNLKTQVTSNQVYNKGIGRTKDMPELNASGRWPTNLLFSHSLECRQVGTTEVKSNGAYPVRGPGSWESSNGWKNDKIKERINTGGASGTETVPVWHCAPDCPVAELDRQSGQLPAHETKDTIRKQTSNVTFVSSKNNIASKYKDNGGASRFYPVFEYSDADRLAIFGYFAKPSTSEKNAGLDDLAPRPKVFNGQAATPSASVAAGSVEDKFSTAPARNHHPTVKSTALMSWLIRLVTPPAAPDGREPLVVDLFAGSGSGGVAAAVLGGVNWHGYDLDPEYVEIAQRRISFARLPKEVQNARRDQYFIDWSAL